ncbi:MAG: cell wall-active antibiotics response protein [Chloroflexi bacterium]|nr:cell wall-active antibiotics response protein [Chloroflexota bacterium]
MRKQGLVVGGVVLVALGVLGVLGGLLRIRFGAWFWPVVLIALGAWMIVRPRMLPAGVTSSQKILGDFDRKGIWQVAAEDFNMVLGSVKLDMTQASIPDGETAISVSHVLGDTKIVLPEGVGLKVDADALVTDAKILGTKIEGFGTPVRYASDGYDEAAKRIKLQVTSLLGDIRAERS